MIEKSVLRDLCVLLNFPFIIIRIWTVSSYAFQRDQFSRSSVHFANLAALKSWL